MNSIFVTSQVLLVGVLAANTIISYRDRRYRFAIANAFLAGLISALTFALMVS